MPGITPWAAVGSIPRVDGHLSHYAQGEPIAFQAENRPSIAVDRPNMGSQVHCAAVMLWLHAFHLLCQRIEGILRFAICPVPTIFWVPTPPCHGVLWKKVSEEQLMKCISLKHCAKQC